MLKMMGLCLVFFACTGMGLGMAKGIRRELETAQELLRLVRRIGSEVRCYKMPLPQIYREFDSLLGKEFLTLLAKGEIISAFDLVCVDPAVRAVCEPFFERVGRCSAQECELFQNECVAELGRLIEEKKVQVAEKTKVYRSLGLAGGAAAVILLI